MELVAWLIGVLLVGVILAAAARAQTPARPVRKPVPVRINDDGKPRR
jgi:hypothetical protein